MSFFIEAKRKFGEEDPAYIPVKEPYEHIINRNDLYQRATVCRGVFGLPFPGFAESGIINIEDEFETKVPTYEQDDFLGNKWKELATFVANPSGTQNVFKEKADLLRYLSASLLKHKKLDKIFVDDRKKYVACDITIKGSLLNFVHEVHDWHIDQLGANVENYEAATSLQGQTLVAIVALKDIPGTLFYEKKTKKSINNPVAFIGPWDCRDPGDNNAEGVSEPLKQGDLNLHAVHWTCHKVPKRDPPSGVMHIKFNLPYECFGQVVNNLVAQSMDEVKELRVPTLNRPPLTPEEEKIRKQLLGDIFYWDEDVDET